jgi:hypothetical protein
MATIFDDSYRTALDVCFAYALAKVYSESNLFGQKCLTSGCLLCEPKKENSDE